MSELDLLQRQREILRTFRQATARRATAETDAKARRKAKQEAADAALNQARQAAAAQLAEARKAQEQAQAALTQAELQHLLEQPRPSPTTLRPGDHTVQKMTHSVYVATKAPTSIQAGIEALQRWQAELGFAGDWQSLERLLSWLLSYSLGGDFNPVDG